MHFGFKVTHYYLSLININIFLEATTYTAQLIYAEQNPQLARGLGKGLREMKDTANGIEREITKEMNEVKDKTDIKKLIDKK